RLLKPDVHPLTHPLALSERNNLPSCISWGSLSELLSWSSLSWSGLSLLSSGSSSSSLLSSESLGTVVLRDWSSDWLLILWLDDGDVIGKRLLWAGLALWVG